MYNHYTITVITSAISETPSTSARDTILPDQINNLLQHKVSLRHHKSNRECLRNNAVDIAVNPIPAPRPDVPIHSHLSVVVRHIVSTSPKYVIQDDGEVYNIPHHTSNILLADKRERLRQVNDTSRCSLTCLDTRHKPIQRSHYRGFDASSIIWCVTYAPRRHAANRPRQVFDDVRHPFLEYCVGKTL